MSRFELAAEAGEDVRLDDGGCVLPPDMVARLRRAHRMVRVAELALADAQAEWEANARAARRLVIESLALDALAAIELAPGLDRAQLARDGAPAPG